MAKINGNDLVIKFASTEMGTKNVFAHAQNATLSFSNSLIETTTKASSSWMENLAGKKSFTLSTDGLIDYASVANAQNFEAFVDIAIAGTLIYFTFGAGNDTYDGSGYIDSFSANGPTDDAASYSVSITGTGTLTKA